ncbi:hypothetical protein [Candidatus Korobacter versatilis]|uniref:hypothetical protein n=1 Tax=Candidatus Korobacter versatilis TaxID=658062 RepID=UPI0003240CA6|nr:hypothetical protein [Candidatus Koribacter versatilis]
MPTFICERCGHEGPRVTRSRANLIVVATLLSLPMSSAIAAAFLYRGVATMLQNGAALGSQAINEATQNAFFTLAVTPIAAIPLLAYGLFVLFTLRSGCSSCGSRALIPLGSPVGRRMTAASRQADELGAARAEVRSLMGR